MYEENYNAYAGRPRTDILDFSDSYVANCCAMPAIEGFWFDNGGFGGKKSELKYQNDLEADLRDFIKGSQENNKALLCATTNSNQRIAMEVLRDVGFQCIGPLLRTKSGEKSPAVYLWYYILREEEAK